MGSTAALRLLLLQTPPTHTHTLACLVCCIHTNSHSVNKTKATKTYGETLPMLCVFVSVTHNMCWTKEHLKSTDGDTGVTP